MLYTKCYYYHIFKKLNSESTYIYHSIINQLVHI
jgi:hypothetical protein